MMKKQWLLLGVLILNQSHPEQWCKIYFALVKFYDFEPQSGEHADKKGIICKMKAMQVQNRSLCIKQTSAGAITLWYPFI